MESDSRRVRLQEELHGAEVAEGRPTSFDRIWRKNEMLVYAGNFLHMIMYTMCLGSVFDIFLYNLSEQKQALIGADPIQIGSGVPALPPMRVDTHSSFELIFDIWPSSKVAGYSPNSTCRKLNTCGTSIIHITDGSGNGDCCKVGNRMPFILLSNRSTQMHLTMDTVDQDESMDIFEYDRLQKCRMWGQLTPDAWSSIKVKASGVDKSKGRFGGSASSEDGGVILLVNGKKVCELEGARYYGLPAVPNSMIFFGALQPPLRCDVHIAANAKLRNVKYGRPASNLFVGTFNSIQGIVALGLMYPIGWAGDHMNRYIVIQASLVMGFAATGLMIAAVLSRNVPCLVIGVVVFTCYQQSISAIIYAILADNVSQARRTRSGVNYKTWSTLAQALGVLAQLALVIVNPNQDSWSWSTFNLMLLSGWILLPFITLAIVLLTPVGRKISSIPNMDEAREIEEEMLPSTGRLSEAWLDERVWFSQRRRFVVALTVNAFFILTLLANGMTSRYFSLYFTQVKKFSPVALCSLNAACRIWIAIFAQIGNPLARLIGRSNLIVILHTASALFTLGIYGGNFFEPSLPVACLCYLMRFACLQTRDPLLYSITMDVVPQSQRARWAALNSLRTLSFAASAALGGYLADIRGYEFSFNITVAALLAGLVVYVPAWVWFPRSEGMLPAARRDASPARSPRACDPPSLEPGIARSPMTSHVG